MAAIDTKINNIKTRISNRTALQNLVPGTVAGDLVESFAIELDNVGGSAQAYADRNSILTAVARDLDTIGEFFGVPRLPTVTPVVTDTMKTLKFYIDTSIYANFGSVNTSQDIVVKAGTAIEGATQSALYKFILEKDVTLNKSLSEQYISAKLVSGLNDVIPAGVLTSHTFKGYTESGNSALKIVNSFVIGTGRLQESDDNYKVRLKQSLSVFPKTTFKALNDYIVSVPGVSKAVIQGADSTGGTLNIYVQSVAPYTSDETIRNIEASIASFINPWCSYNVLRPDYIGLKVSLSLSVTTTAQYQTNAAFQKLIQDAISKYINNYNGSTFELNYLIDYARTLGYSINSGTIISASMYLGEGVAREERVMDIANGQTFFFINETERMIVEPILSAITVSFV